VRSKANISQLNLPHGTFIFLSYFIYHILSYLSDLCHIYLCESEDDCYLISFVKFSRKIVQISSSFFLLEIFASFNEQLNHLLAYDINSLVHFVITNYIITVRFLNFDMHIAHNESQGLGSKMI